MEGKGRKERVVRVGKEETKNGRVYKGSEADIDRGEAN